MTLFLAAIGPLGQPASRAWFLFPGNPERPAVVAPTLERALPDLAAIAAGRSIACEPALAVEAAACGLAAGAWSDGARADFAAIALDIDDRGSLGQIADARAILQFCRAAAAFQAHPPARAILSLPTDDRHPPRQALVIAGPGLVLPDAPDGMDGLSVILSPGLAAVEDALRRVAGLTLVPRPFRLREGQKLAVTAAELGLLTRAMARLARPPLH